MNKYIVALLLAFFNCVSCVWCAQGYGPVDPRCLPIDDPEIVRDAANTSLSIDQQIVVIWRSIYFRRIYTSAKAYADVAARKPNDANAQLLSGIANERAFYFAILHQKECPSPTDPNDYYAAGMNALTKAYSLAPDSPLVDAQYGFYIWQQGIDEPRGYDLVKSAADRSDDPYVQLNLSLIYSNPSMSHYSLTTAEHILLTLISKDETWALAHKLLGMAYVLGGDENSAKMEAAQVACLTRLAPH